MSTHSAAPRTGRFYTTARRHPWVLGKVADFKIPLGPYTPAQIAVAAVGGLLLIETVTWWSWLGPLPLAAWLVAIWAVRRPKFAARAPLPAAVGWMTLLAQPAAGRIGGRTARDRAPRLVRGGFLIEDLGADDVASDRTAAAGSALPRADRPPRPVRRPRTPTAPRARRPRAAARPAPVTRARVASPAQRLLAQAAARQNEGVWL
ncbi:hypothetical protein DWB77_00075 [Streptomyces hundungensis]|uniref:Uncharacterized protein n=1 Tax=Streptomyces hundungensis TaxID=1077946 RepID=A0A387HBF5_9ACTN|nr:hypothetical protein [Streptomyces hundungensis]AYG77968.1 hypothetical protein DWB77_00075 [Streptomyces hundungensis]